MPREYVFVDEWDVRAPIEEVFEAIADVRTYPSWWKPVYISAEADGPPEAAASRVSTSRGGFPTRFARRRESPGSSDRARSRLTSTATSRAAGSGR